MKTAIKLKMQHWKNGNKVLDIEKFICGYCESKFTYYKKKENILCCRECGKESLIEVEEKEK